MRVERSVGYGLYFSRMPSAHDTVLVRLRKHYWSVTTGSRSREVATAAVVVTGMSERDVVEAALREILRAYVDEIA